MKLLKEIPCDCGREHKTEISEVISCRGAIEKLPETLTRLGCKRPFVLCDDNTYRAAGERAESILTKANIRDKYTASRLVFDLGLTEKIKDYLKK